MKSSLRLRVGLVFLLVIASIRVIGQRKIWIEADRKYLEIKLKRQFNDMANRLNRDKKKCLIVKEISVSIEATVIKATFSFVPVAGSKEKKIWDAEGFKMANELYNKTIKEFPQFALLTFITNWGKGKSSQVSFCFQNGKVVYYSQ